MNKLAILLFVTTFYSLPAISQPVGMEVGQVLIVNFPTVRDGSDQAFKALLTEISTSWAKGKPGVAAAHFVADRGTNNGGHLLVCSIKSIADRANFPTGTPFGGAKSSAVILNPSSYTEYQLIGADKVAALPIVGILGMHYI